MGEENSQRTNDLIRICGIISRITKLDVRLFDGKGEPVFEMVSHRIPQFIACVDDWAQIDGVLRNGSPESYCYHTNVCGLEYAACGLRNGDEYAGFAAAGPFLSSVPDSDFISSVIQGCGLPIIERQPLKEFYESLTVAGMRYAGDLAALMVNLFSKPYTVPRLVSGSLEPIPTTRRDIKSDAVDARSIINARYDFEKEMMSAISKGDKARAVKLLDENDALLSFPGRADSTIRSLKNISFVLNTLCRISAERGGVQPVYLHSISEKFAIMIERAPNLPSLKELSHSMVDEYCSLARAVSGLKYSALVKKAADYIDLSIYRQLTIKEIADEVHANPAHLSRKFKSETGMTIVDYINLRRVEEAKIYLESMSATVTEVALMVGYNDLNYFGRVFKKVTGMTPSQYIRRRSASEQGKEGEKA